MSHKTEKNDVDGIKRILNWLSYIPKRKGEPLPITVSSDPVERDVEFVPDTESGSYDPRWLLEGRVIVEDKVEKRLLGFFDDGSFDEIMSGWARTVIIHTLKVFKTNVN